MSDEQSPFVVGVDVALYTPGYYDGLYRPLKVVKVYKNGNFTINDENDLSQQWKPGQTRNYSTNEWTWYADKTGRDSFSRRTQPRVVLLTEEFKADAEARVAKRVLTKRAKLACDILSRIPNEDLTEQEIEVLEKLVVSIDERRKVETGS